MKQQLAQFLSDNFQIEVVNEGAKGLAFATEQSAEMRGALSNVLEAVKGFKQLAEMTKGGSRYRLHSRLTVDDEWKPTQFDFDDCNQAIIRAANISKDPAAGEVQVYDALKSREMFYFPAGGY